MPSGKASSISLKLMHLLLRIFAFYVALHYTIFVCAVPGTPGARTRAACPQTTEKGRQKGEAKVMDIAVGDIILTRKKHPCGAQSFEVLRVGMDFKIRCTGCGHEVMLPRAKIEKNIKKVIKPGQV